MDKVALYAIIAHQNSTISVETKLSDLHTHLGLEPLGDTTRSLWIDNLAVYPMMHQGGIIGESADFISSLLSFARSTGLAFYLSKPECVPVGRVVSDLDGTLVATELLVELAKLVDRDEEMARQTECCMLGIVAFADSFRQRTEMIHDLSIAQLYTTAQALPLAPGADTMAEILKRYSVAFDVASGGYDYYVEGVMRQRLGFDRALSSRMKRVDDQGRIGSYSFDRIVDAEAKRRFVMDDPLHISASTLAIGDGSNDISMLLEAGHALLYPGIHPQISSIADIMEWILGVNESDIWNSRSIG